METMSVNTGNSHSNKRQASEHSETTNEEKRPSVKEVITPVFDNHGMRASLGASLVGLGSPLLLIKGTSFKFGSPPMQELFMVLLWLPSVSFPFFGAGEKCTAIAWHERRKKWVGNQRVQRAEKDPIISWSTSYEDLLSTNESFPEPIPLTEMVDFLVDIWHDEGLFD